MIKINIPVVKHGKLNSVLLVMLMLTGCDRSTAVDQFERYEKEMQGDAVSSDDNGKLLNEIAGRATAPMVVKRAADNILSPEALKYAGRYHAVISCEDPLAICDNGHSEFILNLLPDGTAYRTIVHLGAITFESQHQYRQDRWSFEPKLNQITLHRGSGVKFFYQISGKNMVMDLDKIRRGTPENIEYFANGGAFPAQAYVLKKIE